jgi:membrane carboxypeptidase/penicillin-binding protein
VIPSSLLTCPACHEGAGKTGTQQHTPGDGEPASAANTNSQTWMVGYTPSVSAAVWVGSDGDKALRGPTGQPLTPSVVAGPVWQRFMQLYLTGKPAERFDRVQAITAPQDDQLQFQLQQQQQQQQFQQQQQDQDQQEQRFTIGRGGNQDQQQQQQQQNRVRRDGRGPGRGNGNDTGQANFGP